MGDIDYSIFDMYFELVEDSSESPFLYHRWTLISATAALLGRQAYMQFGFDKIYPNMYVCLMGNAGTRKSSAIKVTRSLLEATGYNKFAREKSSSQKFIKDLSEGFDNINNDTIESPEDMVIEEMLPMEDRPPAEVYISAGELEDFLGQGDGQFISLLTNMWDNLDKYAHGKMTSSDIFIKEPTVNMIGGCTPITFSTVFPPEVIGQGMLSRMLLVFGAGARKKLTIPSLPDEKKLNFFFDHMRAVKEQMVGNFEFTEEAFKVFDDVYKHELDLKDNRLESYINRRHIHFYKLCIVIAALNLTKTITKDIAIEANTILHYTERKMPKALGEFGKSFKSDNAAVLLSAIENHYKLNKSGITLQDLFSVVSTHFDSYQKDYIETVQKIKTSGKIKIASGGKLVPCDNDSIPLIPWIKLGIMREYREEKSSNKATP